MKPIHPGRILKCEIRARKLSANKLALALRVPSGHITQILNEKRGVSVETALIYGQTFAGRYLLVLVRVLSEKEVMALRLQAARSFIKIITARDMNENQRKIYLNKKG